MYLTPYKASDGRPLFVRDGIIISDVRGARAREIHSLVVIEDRPLAALLGDSENPAHTQWQKASSNFRGLYTYGPGVIEFVTHSVGELLSIVNRSSEEADPSLTIDFFSIERSEDDDDGVDSEQKRPRPQKGAITGKESIDVAARPARVLIRRSSGGFAVTPGAALPTQPFLIELRCAYDTRTGNALKKWHPADFLIGSEQTPVKCEGAIALRRARDNWLLLQVNGPEFRVSVTGFDLARDIIVRADVREPSNDDSQN
jgi:hypothetical protein